jgi:hypothetical protein
MTSCSDEQLGCSTQKVPDCTTTDADVAGYTAALRPDMAGGQSGALNGVAYHCFNSS